MKTFLTAQLVCFGLILTLSDTRAQPAESATNSSAPQMLDLQKCLRERFITSKATNATFQHLVGVQTFDGLPFHIEGRGWVYGLKEAQANNAKPDAYADFIGINVDRKFDELHLLHASRWQAADGQDIALIRAHYADGTTNDWTIIYGAQVRDWQRLHSEQSESLSDTNSKIVWRGVPGSLAMSSSVRLFKTKFINPFPDKVVTTLDVISSRRLAAYDLVATTVANRDPSRPVTKPLTGDGPRRFRKGITIKVVDAVTSKPITDVLLDPSMIVDGAGVIASPQLTSTNGQAEIRYPGTHVTSLYIEIGKPGYQTQHLAWGAKKVGPAFWQRAIEYIYLVEGFVPSSATVTLQPDNTPPAPTPSTK